MADESQETPPMRLALMIEGQEGVSWAEWCAVADACERHGIDTLFRSDHYLSPDVETDVALDAWTTIAALAARTTTLRLGTLVSPVTFRLPGLLAIAAATADHVSGGRIELGLGAGWLEREHRAFGFPFPALDVRLEMLAEQLEIVHRLWTDERVDFQGTHYSLEQAPGVRTVQTPHPPLLVGGSGRRGTAEPAARFADEYNCGYVSLDDFAVARSRVLAACERHGRDPATIRFSLMACCIVGASRADAIERAHELHPSQAPTTAFDDWLQELTATGLVGSVDEVAERLRAYERAGCGRVMLQHLLHTDLESIELIGCQLSPRLA